MTDWWFWAYPSEKYESQLGWLFPMKNDGVRQLGPDDIPNIIITNQMMVDLNNKYLKIQSLNIVFPGRFVMWV